MYHPLWEVCRNQKFPPWSEAVKETTHYNKYTNERTGPTHHHYHPRVSESELKMMVVRVGYLVPWSRP